ncbi:urotensin 1 [Aplochiton taeniatus]
MKPVPLVLLLASVLLSSHIRPSACRPRDLPDFFDGRGGAFKSQMDEVLLRAVGKDAISYLLGEKLLSYLQRNPRTRSMNAFPQFPFEEGVVATSRLGMKGALAHLARGLASVDTDELAPVYEVDHPGNSLEDPVELSKRNEDPPISIDLTFHLLRNMIEMAKVEGQREQAELNRKFLDEVGK